MSGFAQSVRTKQMNDAKAKSDETIITIQSPGRSTTISRWDDCVTLDEILNDMIAPMLMAHGYLIKGRLEEVEKEKSRIESTGGAGF